MISNSLTETIRSSKEKFYYKLSTKLANPSTSWKTYWSILKTFVNGKKVPIIPSLLVNDKFVTNFLEKANLFNEFFSKQCQPLQNNSTLPKSNTYHTENRLNDITFDNKKTTENNSIIRCKQSSWIWWYFNKNTKANPSIEGVHLTLPPHVFSVRLKSGACYITDQFSGGPVKNKIK